MCSMLTHSQLALWRMQAGALLRQKVPKSALGDAQADVPPVVVQMNPNFITS